MTTNRFKKLKRRKLRKKEMSKKSFKPSARQEKKNAQKQVGESNHISLEAKETS